MQSKSSAKSHVDRSRFGKRSRSETNAEARNEKKRLGLTGKYKRFLVHVGGITYEIPIPDVKSIRERMALSQSEFSERFQISKRTLQQWEQRRAVPDMPARILLKAIEDSPDIIAKAAAAVRKQMISTSR
jgi:DNA-binding transcriptional regulator YiaG